MKLILLGPPGSGKGTQAERISVIFNLIHLSTGEIFREEISKNTELGRKIKKVIQKGNFVNDKLVNELVCGRIRGLDGFILDGYPRNIIQAEELNAFLENHGGISAVLVLDIPDNIVKKRLQTRMSCSKCSNVENVSDIGFTGYCTECGSKLIKRNDDQPDQIEKRLELYHRKTVPLIQYYRKKVIHIDGAGEVDSITEEITEKLEKWV